MGREVRRVPANWEHPKHSVPNQRAGRMEEYVPLLDDDFEVAMNEWLSELMAWLPSYGGGFTKELKDNVCGYKESEPYRSFCDWHGNAPDPEQYRPSWKPEEMTWLQVYETVSEGTPATPPFATPKELIEYLVRHGDFWDQKRGEGGWKRENAERFVRSGYAPSAAAVGGKVYEPRDGI